MIIPIYLCMCTYVLNTAKILKIHSTDTVKPRGDKGNSERRLKGKYLTKLMEM